MSHFRRGKRKLEATDEVAEALLDVALQIEPYVEITDLPYAILGVLAKESDLFSDVVNAAGFSGLWQRSRLQPSGLIYADVQPDQATQIRGAGRFWLASLADKNRKAKVNSLGRFYALNLCPGRLVQYKEPRVAYAGPKPVFDESDRDLRDQLVRCRWDAGYHQNAKQLDFARKGWISIEEDLGRAVRQAQSAQRPTIVAVLKLLGAAPPAEGAEGCPPAD